MASQYLPGLAPAWEVPVAHLPAL